MGPYGGGGGGAVVLTSSLSHVKTSPLREEKIKNVRGYARGDGNSKN